MTVTNTNYAAPGAHVGSQHDVIEGSTSFRFTAGDDGDVTTGPGAVDPERVAERLRRAADRTQRAQRRTRTTGTHTTGNTASGDDHVHQQIGTNFGDTHHHRNTD